MRGLPARRGIITVPMRFLALQIRIAPGHGSPRAHSGTATDL